MENCMYNDFSHCVWELFQFFWLIVLTIAVITLKNR